MKTNLNPLIVGTVALVPPTLSFAIVMVFVPYSVSQAIPISSSPDFSQLSLSVDQQQQVQTLQLEINSKILAILNRTQQAQMGEKLAQGQNLWQGLASIDLSQAQQSRIQTILKSQRQMILKVLTPEQGQQLLQSLPASIDRRFGSACSDSRGQFKDD
jgi:hypothetical protein